MSTDDTKTWLIAGIGGGVFFGGWDLLAYFMNRTDMFIFFSACAILSLCIAITAMIMHHVNNRVDLSSEEINNRKLQKDALNGMKKLKSKIAFVQACINTIQTTQLGSTPNEMKCVIDYKQKMDELYGVYLKANGYMGWESFYEKYGLDTIYDQIVTLEKLNQNQNQQQQQGQGIGFDQAQSKQEQKQEINFDQKQKILDGDDEGAEVLEDASNHDKQNQFQT